MSYIGREPQIGNFQVCDAISVVNGQAAYTMQVDSTNVVPESSNHVLCSLNGILQKSGSSFTISGSTITFASNLVTGDVIDFIHILGSTLDLGVPSDATVTNAKTNFVTTSSAAGLQIKGDGTTAGALQMNCEQNSHGIKLQSPPHSANQSYTLKFPSGNVTAGKFLKVDSVSGSGTTGVGTMTFADAGANNQPCFLASKSDSNQSISHNTTTKITFNNEIVDSDNAFASSTFTVPSGEGGTYFLSAGIYVGSSQDYNYLSIRKNGSSTNVMNFTTFKNNTSDNTYHVSSLVSASASDTFEVYYSQSKGSAVNVESNSSVGFTFFGGFKVI